MCGCQLRERLALHNYPMGGLLNCRPEGVEGGGLRVDFNSIMVAMAGWAGRVLCVCVRASFVRECVRVLCVRACEFCVSCEYWAGVCVRVFAACEFCLCMCACEFCVCVCASEFSVRV